MEAAAHLAGGRQVSPIRWVYPLQTIKSRPPPQFTWSSGPSPDTPRPGHGACRPRPFEDTAGKGAGSGPQAWGWSLPSPRAPGSSKRHPAPPTAHSGQAECRQPGFELTLLFCKCEFYKALYSEGSHPFVCNGFPPPDGAHSPQGPGRRRTFCRLSYATAWCQRGYKATVWMLPSSSAERRRHRRNGQRFPPSSKKKRKKKRKRKKS